jgi:hypothetical protein
MNLYDRDGASRCVGFRSKLPALSAPVFAANGWELEISIGGTQPAISIAFYIDFHCLIYASALLSNNFT